MIYSVTLDTKVNFAPQTEAEEIQQNIRTIISTRKGTVPLDRDFGLNYSWLDKPYLVARTLMMAEVIEAIQQYEPRANIRDVKFDNEVGDVMAGKLSPRVIYSIGDEEEEDL